LLGGQNNHDRLRSISAARRLHIGERFSVDHHVHLQHAFHLTFVIQVLAGPGLELERGLGLSFLLNLVDYVLEQKEWEISVVG